MPQSSESCRIHCTADAGVARSPSVSSDTPEKATLTHNERLQQELREKGLSVSCSCVAAGISHEINRITTDLSASDDQIAALWSAAHAAAKELLFQPNCALDTIRLAVRKVEIQLYSALPKPSNPDED